MHVEARKITRTIERLKYRLGLNLLRYLCIGITALKSGAINFFKLYQITDPKNYHRL